MKEVVNKRYKEVFTQIILKEKTFSGNTKNYLRLRAWRF